MMSGRQRRRKGHDFERRIAAELRELWPGADVHRSSQAERARQSDVVIAGDVPELAKRLWLELQDARRPAPLDKLKQAQKDAWPSPWDASGRAVVQLNKDYLPLVVWHRLGERSIQVTTTMSVAMQVLGIDGPEFSEGYGTVVTLDWSALLAALRLLSFHQPTVEVPR